MPINDKQQAFINEYMVNGHNATQAYKTAYPDCTSGHKQNGSRLLTNDDILKAIAGLMAELGAEAGYTVTQCQEEYEQARQLGISLNQPSAVVSAVTGKARLYGFDKDNQVNDDQTKEIDQSKAEQARKLIKLQRETAWRY